MNGWNSISMYACVLVCFFRRFGIRPERARSDTGDDCINDARLWKINENISKAISKRAGTFKMRSCRGHERMNEIRLFKN